MFSSLSITIIQICLVSYIGKLFKVVYGVIHKIRKTLHLLEDVVCTIQKVWSKKEAVRLAAGNRILFTLKVFQIGIVLWKSFWSCF